MKIKSEKELWGLPALVFSLQEGEKIENHDFFKGYVLKDQEYLRLFREKNKKGELSFSLFLPSGKQAMFFQSDGKKKFSLRNSIILMRRIIAMAKKEKIKQLTVNFKDFIPTPSGLGLKDSKGMARNRLAKQETGDTPPERVWGFIPEKSGNEEAIVELMAVQFELANFEFTKYKTRPKDGWNVVEKVFVVSKENSKKIQQALDQGRIIGEEINKARALSNTPGRDMTPAKLAEAAAKSGRETGFKVKALKEKDIRKLNMGGVIGVSQGSAERPRFIVIEYLKGGKNEKPVVLVGKGVTFDTGGLNLKPEQAIYEMHMDMSGGAAVIHTIATLARLKIKKNIIGLIPAVENMPSGSSYHPGDVLRTMNGKTIEVLNTDAEGRVILADALEYSKKYKPRLVIDIATLTGAAMSALGQRASAIFTTDPKLEKALRETGEQTGDYVWPLPLWEEFEEEIKGTFGDVANIGKTRYGGAITGAVFLWQFIKDPSKSSGQAIPWVHIDIAPRMTSVEGEFLSKGAAGASIGLLTKFLREF